jgi:predicted ester cyclase
LFYNFQVGGGRKEMSEENIENAMHNFMAAIVERDVEKSLSFFAEDAAYVTPEGTFKGKEELRRYLTWVIQDIPDLTAIDTGIGIIVKGNKAVYEHTLAGTINGVKCRWLSICTYEFSEGKIQRLRSVYDRLSIGKQVAQGWFAKRVLNSFIKRAEKGLY